MQHRPCFLQGEPSIFYTALNGMKGASPMACGLFWHIALALSAQEGAITNLSNVIYPTEQEFSISFHIPWMFSVTCLKIQGA